MEFYDYAVEHSINPVVYNGNLFSADDIEKYDQNYVEEKKVSDIVMIGRGLLYNPELIKLFFNRDNDKKFDYIRFWDFHDEIYRNYQEIMSPDKNVLFHMKELWTYWKELYPESERAVRNILKTKSYGEYEAALRNLK
jgi:tRNA-dihydrouridine synthase